MPIGKLEPFDLNSKQWPAYIRRVKQYIVLNEIKEELHVPLLITVVGEATYALMCDLCSPALPETKKFDQLVKLLSDHLEPQRSEIHKGKNEIENVSGSGSAGSEGEEDRFEDAAAEVEDSGPETRSLSPGPRPPIPPPPNATARDLRAYNRRIKKNC